MQLYFVYYHPYTWVVQTNNSDMILITAATSQFGQAAIDHLINLGVPTSEITGMVRDLEKAAPLKEKGISLVVGDYLDSASLEKAFAGVDKLLFISSGEVQGRSEQHKNVVEAAKAAKVGYIVYTSFYGNDYTANSAISMVSESHLKTEAWLKESGIPHTILKNTVYMDMLPMFIGEQGIASGTIFQPAGQGSSSYVLRTEMAEAAARVLTSEGHAGKVYPISSAQTWSYEDIAAILTDILGKPFTYVAPSAEEFGKAMTEAGVPAAYIGLFTGFALAKAGGELDTPDNTLETLLGRKPTDVKTYLSQVYGA